MADTDKARDLTARFVTDLDKFHPEPAADRLDKVADAGESTGRTLDAMEADAKAAGTAVGGLGDKAKTAASGVDAVGDKADTAATNVDALGDKADTAATNVDALGDKAKTATAGLDDVGQAAKDAGDDVKTGGESADDFATKVKAAFDRAGDAAKTGGRQMEEAGSSAKESLGEVGAEGADTAREVAASFDGSASSIVDGFQEVAANALGAFGPIGVGVGVLAAAGLGLFRAQQAKVKEETDALTQSLKALASGATTTAQATQDYVDNLEDAPKQLREMSRDAKALGVDLNTLAAARAGDAGAVGEVLPKLAAYRKAQDEANTAAAIGAANMADGTEHATRLSGATKNLADEWGAAGDTVKLYQEAVGDSADAQARQQQATEDAAAATEKWQGIVDEAGTTVSTVMGDAAADVAESWDGADKDVATSLAGITQSLEAQTKAANDYADNVTTAAGRVSTDTIKYLQTMPDGGRQAFAELRTASDAEVKKLEDDVAANQVAQKYAAQVTANADGATAAGEAVGAAVRSGLTSSEILSDGDARALAMQANSKLAAQEVTIPVKAKLDTNSLFMTLDAAQRQANVGVGVLVRPRS